MGKGWVGGGGWVEVGGRGGGEKESQAPGEIRKSLCERPSGVSLAHDPNQSVPRNDTCTAPPNCSKLQLRSKEFKLQKSKSFRFDVKVV